MKKRGRPTLAAQTLDEAIHNVYTGNAPKRPRNAIERDVMRKPKGRKPQPQSMTQQAAQFTLYLINMDKLRPSEASRKAAETFKVNADNVRKYVRRLQLGSVVEIDVKVSTMFAQLAAGQSVQVQFVADLKDVNAAFAAAGYNAPETN